MASISCLPPSLSCPLCPLAYSLASCSPLPVHSPCLQGHVREVLWFFDPNQADPFTIDGRCLVRYSDGRVKQSVLPHADARLGYAMAAHGVQVRTWGLGWDSG